jgi:hypothetical protein
MAGPPSPATAWNAVGIPPEPSSTSNPSFSSSSQYAAADWYSRQAGSARSKIRRWNAESSGARAATPWSIAASRAAASGERLIMAS